MQFGLSDQDLTYITAVIEAFAEVKKAVIFGSRAKGNYKQGSDIDIAVLGDEVSFNTIAQLHSRLEEEGPLPYFFDIVDYTHCEHKELIEHIDRVGKTIFERNT